MFSPAKQASASVSEANQEIETTPEMIRAGLEAHAGFNEDFESREDGHSGFSRDA